MSDEPTEIDALVEALNRVRSLHQVTFKAVEPWAKGYRFTGEHCAFDGEHWPCMTISALESPDY